MGGRPYSWRRVGASGTVRAACLPCARAPPELTVVLPAHNEEEILATTVAERRRRACAARGVAFEVLIVENGSTDAHGGAGRASWPRSSPRGAPRSANPAPDYGAGAAPGPARGRRRRRRELRRRLLRPRLPRPGRRPRAASGAGRSCVGHQARRRAPRTPARSPAGMRHLGVLRRCCGVGFGLQASRHPRHEGAWTGPAWCRWPSGAGSAPTSSTPSWCYGRERAGHRRRRGPGPGRGAASRSVPHRPAGRSHGASASARLRLALREE